MTAAEYLQQMSNEEFQSYVDWFTPEQGEVVYGVCHTSHGPIVGTMVQDEVCRRSQAALAALGL